MSSDRTAAVRMIARCVFEETAKVGPVMGVAMAEV